MDKRKINNRFSDLKKGYSSSSHYRIKTEANAEPIATKFVNWEVPDLATLKTSKAYLLKEKINRKERLTRDEKNWICEQVNTNTYFRTAIPLMGYRFDFFDILKKYLVCQYGNWSEYYAPDRTSLRKFLYGRINQIVEISKY